MLDESIQMGGPCPNPAKRAGMNRKLAEVDTPSEVAQAPGTNVNCAAWGQKPVSGDAGPLHAGETPTSMVSARSGRGQGLK